MLSFTALLGIATLALCTRISVADDGLTDEQRSALKQNTDPVRAAALRLSDSQLQWWRGAKVGMFIHWGLYAVPGEGEWVMHNKKIPADEYAKYADGFTAVKFDAKAWADLAQRGGMKYAVLTARHHDGFSLWDSPSSHGHFTSMNAASKRDIIAEYTAAMRSAGIGVGIYYSPMDWRFPAYFKPHELPDNAQLMKQQTYGQIRELMSRYGKIDVLWYDGGWLAHKGSDADAAWLWDPITLNTMVRELQPNVVISPRSGWEGDFRCEEGAGEIKGPIRDYAWEKCLTLGRAWGYTKDRHTMALAEVQAHIVNAVTRGGNILINVGPDPEGVIPPEQVKVIEKLGQWLQTVGPAIYATRPGPFEPVDGVCGTTQRDRFVYVHVLRWPEGGLVLPSLPKPVKSSRVLTGGSVQVAATTEKTVLTPAPGTDRPAVTIIELELQP